MWKSTPKRPTRSSDENIGCMHGLFNIFYIYPGSNSQRLLTDKPRRSVFSFRRWYAKKRNKLKLLTNGKAEYERSNHDGHFEAQKKILGSSSFNTHKEERIPKIQCSRDAGSQQVMPDSGSSSHVGKNRKQTNKTSAVVCSENANRTRVSTSSESSQTYLLRLDEGFSNNINVAALLEELYDKKHKDQQMDVGSKNRIFSYPPDKSITNEMFICLDQPDVQLPKDDPVLQKTLDEVLENLPLDNFSDPSDTTTDVVNHQSEELEKVLETLKSNKELLLEVLQDPKILNLLLAKHIQNLRVVHGTSTDKPHTEELRKLEELELLSECDRSTLEDISDVSQKLSRIVVLKPNPIRNQNSSDVIDPGSPSQSSHSSSPSMDEFLPLHFLIQEIKRRLKQAFGMSQKNQQLTDEVPCKMPYASKTSGHISKQIVENFKAADLIGSSSSELVSQPSLKKAQSRELQSCTESGSNPHSNDRSKCLNTKRVSRKLEDFLDVPEYSPDPGVRRGKDEDAFMLPQQMSCSPTLSPGPETNREQLGSSEKNSESLLHADDDSTVKLHVLGLGPEILDSHIQETTSTTETSSSEDIEKIINEIGIEAVEESSCADVISDHKSKGSDDLADQREHDKSSPCSTLDFSKEQLILESSLIPSTPNIESTENTNKPERPSPISVLDSLLLDKIIRSGSMKSERDEFRISPRKIDFEDHDDFKVVIASSNPDTNLQTCVGDDEFKFEYMRALVEASDLCHSDTSNRDTSSQLLDPSLYDEIETPSGEIPDDLKLLFDCINEVLEEIHESSSSCIPWVSFVRPNLRPFPAGEKLIQEVRRSLNIHFVRWFPITLEGIVKKDLNIRMWMDIRSGVEEFGIIAGDEILDKILEETILELWD